MQLAMITLIALMPLILSTIDPQEPTHVCYEKKTVDTLLEEANRDYGVICYSRQGALTNNLEGVRLSFAARGSRTIPEARMLIVSLCEKYLSIVNSDEEALRYFAVGRFLPREFKISVAFRDEQGKNLRNRGSSKDLLGYVALIDGKILYAIQNDERVPYQTIHRESYEEALAIVQKENPRFLPVKKESVFEKPLQVNHRRRGLQRKADHDQVFKEVCFEILERESGGLN